MEIIVMVCEGLLRIGICYGFGGNSKYIAFIVYRVLFGDLANISCMLMFS